MNLLQHLDPRTRKALLDLGQELRLAPGELLVRRGELGGDIFIVQHGQLEVVDPRARPALVLDLLGPGHVVGELGFVDAAPRSADVRARQATTCLALRRPDLRRLLAEDPLVARGFWAALAEVAVQRIRTLGDTLRAGLMSRPGLGEDEGADEVAELAAELHGAWAQAQGRTAGEPPAEVRLGQALARVGATLARVGDPDQADALGAALAAATGDVLRQARTAALLLARPPGQPAPAELLAHLRGAAPQGQGEAGRALDAALRALPTLAAQPGLVAALADPGPALVLSPAPATLGHPDQAPCEDPVSLALAGVVAPAGSQRLVLVETIADALPDRLLVSLALGLRRALAPGGRLLLAHACPSPDNPLLDHLLRWPLLRRSPRVVAELLAAAGLRSTVQGPPGALAVHLATAEGT